LKGIRLTDQPEFNPDDYEVEVIKPIPATTERSLARRIALQVLYELDCTNHNPNEVITFRLRAAQGTSSEPVSKKTAYYVRRLVEGVLTNRPTLDSVIRRYAREWPLEQMAIVDRCILRMAIYEFGVRARVPAGVAIDEAVELAKLFGADGTAGFVNGVLGTVAEDEALLEQIRQAKD
jgi:transcription antitermination protein NusB